ncbi:MAG: lamin tail domain-containing protein, partial [Ignavibacteriae bacterium]|nr:lamin tail domain-containing protein [Ignavibacteriota bacterium]
HLNFSQSFATNILYTININNVKDVAGNVMNQAAKAFMYAPVIDNSVFRILINEVMTDENPEPNQLPAVDYIELYNRSADAVNLKGWAIKLKDAGDTLYFDEVTLLPDCYLVLCDDGNVTQLSSFCQNIYSFTSFVVNNETCVTLYNSGGEIEHQLNYDAGWYHNSIKSQGGWSLELIDPANPCGGLENWKASTDIKGGTPGERNAVYGNNPDKLPPKIEKICVIDSNCIKVYFNEQMLKVRLLNTAAYSVEPHLNINNIIYTNNRETNSIYKHY